MNEGDGNVARVEGFGLKCIKIDESRVYIPLYGVAGTRFSQAAFFERAAQRPFELHHGAQLMRQGEYLCHGRRGEKELDGILAHGMIPFYHAKNTVSDSPWRTTSQ